MLLGKEHELHLMDYMTDFHFDMRNSLIELHKVGSLIRMLSYATVGTEIAIHIFSFRRAFCNIAGSLLYILPGCVI